MADTSRSCYICKKDIAVRQHCLQCIKCLEWIHRICTPGITVKNYRKLVHTQKILEWQCVQCKDGVIDQPEKRTGHQEKSKVQHERKTVQPEKKSVQHGKIRHEKGTRPGQRPKITSQHQKRAIYHESTVQHEERTSQLDEITVKPKHRTSQPKKSTAKPEKCKYTSGIETPFSEIACNTAKQTLLLNNFTNMSDFPVERDATSCSDTDNAQAPSASPSPVNTKLSIHNTNPADAEGPNTCGFFDYVTPEKATTSVKSECLSSRRNHKNRCKRKCSYSEGDGVHGNSDPPYLVRHVSAMRMVIKCSNQSKGEPTKCYSSSDSSDSECQTNVLYRPKPQPRTSLLKRAPVKYTFPESSPDSEYQKQTNVLSRPTPQPRKSIQNRAQVKYGFPKTSPDSSDLDFQNQTNVLSRPKPQSRTSIQKRRPKVEYNIYKSSSESSSTDTDSTSEDSSDSDVESKDLNHFTNYKTKTNLKGKGRNISTWIDDQIKSGLHKEYAFHASANSSSNNEKIINRVTKEYISYRHQGTVMLSDSEGYLYTLKCTRGAVKHWICSFCNERPNYCYATVRQSGKSYEQGCHPHPHKASRRMVILNSITIKVRREVIYQLSKSVSDIVHKIIQEELKSYNGVSVGFPSESSVIKIGTFYRTKHLQAAGLL